MNAGTDRRIRGLTMRHGIVHPETRALRGRCLPTKNGHAGSARARARVIREYQSDSSSKRPAPSSVLQSCHPPGRRKTINDLQSLLDWGSFHISWAALLALHTYVALSDGNPNARAIAAGSPCSQASVIRPLSIRYVLPSDNSRGRSGRSRGTSNAWPIHGTSMPSTIEKLPRRYGVERAPRR
jgi:hypothetical protein